MTQHSKETQDYAVAMAREDDALNHLIKVSRILTEVQGHWHVAGAEHKMTLARILLMRARMEKCPYVDIIHHNCLVAETHLKQAKKFATARKSEQARVEEIEVERIASWLRDFCNLKNIEVVGRLAVWCMPADYRNYYGVISLRDPALCCLGDDREEAIKQVNNYLKGYIGTRKIEKTNINLNISDIEGSAE